MTPRRLLTLAGAAVGSIALAGGAVVLWPLAWPPDPDAGLRTVSGRLVGETTGYVTSIETEGSTLRISPSLFGFHPLIVQVGRDTTILVRGKEGGLGDLLPDMPVRVAYEMRGATRIATAIELLVGEGSPRSTALSVSPPAASIPATLTGAEPASAPSASAAPRPQPIAAPAARVRAAKPTTAAPPVATIPRVGAPGPADDGSAAIDWLLEESRRR